MKIMTVLGTRPEIIRLSRIIPLLDKLCDHLLVHTGQNYDKTLYDIFFEELGVRPPDHILECRSDTMMQQVGAILTGCEKIINEQRPDRLLILGDTNSGLSAIAAKRMGIPVFHMEAGNRCYDDRVPEEINRRIIDHSSDILMPYTERSRANLLREGIEASRIYVTGNPIKEVLDYYKEKIDNSRIMEKLDIDKGKYFIVTIHREENVDQPERLSCFIDSFRRLYDKYGIPVIVSLHPRTRSQLHKQEKVMPDGVQAIAPLGLIDFVHLEKNAKCVLTDSGTVQEECCIFGVPNVTIRDVTERPETIEVGSNMLSGAQPDIILSCVQAVLNQSCDWTPPHEYLTGDVSGTVAKIMLGYKCR